MGRCGVCGNDYEKTMVITMLHCAEMAGVPGRKVNA